MFTGKTKYIIVLFLFVLGTTSCGGNTTNNNNGGSGQASSQQSSSSSAGIPDDIGVISPMTYVQGDGVDLEVKDDLDVKPYPSDKDKALMGITIFLYNDTVDLETFMADNNADYDSAGYDKTLRFTEKSFKLKDNLGHEFPSYISSDKGVGMYNQHIDVGFQARKNAPDAELKLFFVVDKKYFEDAAANDKQIESMTFEVSNLESFPAFKVLFKD